MDVRQWLLTSLMMVIPLVLSLTVHEWAHAYSAYRLGDDTAARMGRLTLNPIPHIDAFGTLLLPLLGVPFGWAKPVPVNPANFRRDVDMRRGMMITAIAGPASNVALAFVCITLYMLLLRLGQGLDPTHQPPLATLLITGTRINIALAIFNMLPIPPLDGSRVADGLMPARHQEAWESFSRFGPILLIGVIFFGGALIAWPLNVAFEAMVGLAQAIVL